jgi:hypothetical protein
MNGNEAKALIDKVLDFGYNEVVLE